MVCDGVHAVVGDVGHRHSEPTCRVEVDIVHTDAVAHDGRAGRHRGQLVGAHRREVDECHVCGPHRRGGLGSGTTLVDDQLGADPGRSRSFVTDVDEAVVGDDEPGHRSSPRPARFAMKPRMPTVQRGADSAVVTSLTSVPSCSEATTTASPRWWVKPSPGTSLSSVGANILQKNRAKPSGYWW